MDYTLYIGAIIVSEELYYRVNARIEKELGKGLVGLSKRNGRTVTAELSDAIRSHLKRHGESVDEGDGEGETWITWDQLQEDRQVAMEG